jgi:transcriptional regulator with XRE-family HTH domain
LSWRFGKFFAVFLGVRVMDLPHLRNLRRRAVMSQEDLAEKSGVARDTISKLETRQRGAYPSTIRKLAAGLEVEPRMLLGGVEYLEEESGGGAPKKPKSDKDRKVGF